MVDLRTGQTRPHKPTDYMTKMTAVTPDADCPCPLWLDFLATITAGDAELQAYLKRMAGYCLTGSIREHALFFAFGTGGNGKGVFLNCLTAILAAYAAVASMETFTASQGDRHPTDLAMLRGARLVTAQETEEGRRWAESRIKALTGGDPITARFMRQDFFTFEPVFKLLIAGNHRPGLRGVDEAIRRRMNLLPFTVTIPASDRDPELPEKLRKEWPGILAWAVAGCLEWREDGLSAPAAVTDATADYLDTEDGLGVWLAECCIPDPDVNAAPFPSSLLYSSWRTWAEQAGEFVGSQKRFTQAMVSKGYQSERITKDPDRGKMGLRGVRFAAVDPGPQPPAGHPAWTE